MPVAASPLAQAAGSFTPGSPGALSYLNELLAKQNVDAGAADAVFRQEGLSGGIGDGGHAFGPGQFNNAGGVWTGRYQGMTPEQENQVAWSPTGLTELASRVGSVAAGLHGTAAIDNIVTRFERPANPSAEIARADAALGGGAYTPSPVPAAAPAPFTLAHAAAGPAPASRGPALSLGALSQLVNVILGGHR